MKTAATLSGRVDAVVIGGSAGGVEALSLLLPALPAGLATPVFIVLHLPRDSRSLLVEVFTPRCAVPVAEAEDGLPVRPGHVYFSPPDYHLLIDAGPTLALSVDPPLHFSRPSIDVLFESAADVYGARLLGIVLTGGNDDGALGLDRIRRAGGLTAVQQPGTAFASRMPEAALALGLADFVLPLEPMAGLLRTLDTLEPA